MPSVFFSPNRLSRARRTDSTASDRKSPKQLNRSTCGKENEPDRPPSRLTTGATLRKSSTDGNCRERQPSGKRSEVLPTRRTIELSAAERSAPLRFEEERSRTTDGCSRTSQEAPNDTASPRSSLPFGALPDVPGVHDGSHDHCRHTTGAVHQDGASSRHWVSCVIAALARRLPEDCEDGLSDLQRQFGQSTLASDSDSEAASVKIGYELFKRLFRHWRGFAANDDREGMNLVTVAFETLLKIRQRRIHQSLMRTHFRQLFEVLSYKYPALSVQMQARQWVSIPGLALDENLKELVSEWHQAQAVHDVLSPPCDNTTFAGVEEYANRLGSAIAVSLLQVGVIDQISSALATHDGSVDSQQVVALWRMLGEAIHLCVEESTVTEAFIRALYRSKLLGRICKAVCNRREVGAQCMAATVLERLCRHAEYKTAILGLITDFPEAWDYLLPPLYGGDTALQSQMAASVAAIMEGNPNETHPALFQRRTHFSDGISTARDATAICRVATSLLTAAPGGLDGYVQFHCCLLGAATKRLHEHLSAEPHSRGSKGNHLIPLLQYCGAALETNGALFVAEVKALRLPSILHELRGHCSLLPHTKGGALWGALAAVLRSLLTAVAK